MSYVSTSHLWVLVEQLTHKRGSAPCGGQDEDVRSLVGTIGGEGDRGEGGFLGGIFITTLVRGLGCLLAQSCQVLYAAVDSLARGCQAHRAQQAWRFGRKGAEGRVLDGYGG